jgi:hypothetical protein
MTEAEAKAMIGKRVRTLDSSYEVPSGITGTVIGAMRGGVVGQPLATRVWGKIPDPTQRMWVNNIKCDDALKTVIQVCEWDDSLEEI